MVGAHCSFPLSWRWQWAVWWAENQEFLLPVFCLWHRSRACTFLQEQAGVQTQGLIYSELLLGQWETLPGELGLAQVQETLVCYTGQHLNYFSCLHVLSLVSVTLMVYLHFLVSSYFSNIISWISATSLSRNPGHRWVHNPSHTVTSTLSPSMVPFESTLLALFNANSMIFLQHS